LAIRVSSTLDNWSLYGLWLQSRGKLSKFDIFILSSPPIDRKCLGLIEFIALRDMFAIELKVPTGIGINCRVCRRDFNK